MSRTKCKFIICSMESLLATPFRCMLLLAVSAIEQFYWSQFMKAYTGLLQSFVAALLIEYVADYAIVF